MKKMENTENMENIEPLNFLITEVVLAGLSFAIAAYAAINVYYSTYSRLSVTSLWLGALSALTICSGCVHLRRMLQHHRALLDRQDAFPNIVISVLLTCVFMAWSLVLRLSSKSKLFRTLLLLLIGFFLGTCLMLTVLLKEARLKLSHAGYQAFTGYQWYNKKTDIIMTIVPLLLALLLRSTHPTVAMLMLADGVYHVLELLMLAVAGYNK